MFTIFVSDESGVGSSSANPNVKNYQSEEHHLQRKIVQPLPPAKNPISTTTIAIHSRKCNRRLTTSLPPFPTPNHHSLCLSQDGAHLNGKFKGTIFLAVAMDGNNQILPIAFGIGKTESGESWTWFLTKLKECIGENPSLSIISDKVASIEMAIRTVFPFSFHGLCCRHLMVNLRLKSKKGKTFEQLWWRTCKAYRVSDFDELMHTLINDCPDIYNTLLNVGYDKWSRAHSAGQRYNVMTSNSAESINALSRHARKLPITKLIEFFREYLQKWYYNRRNLGVELEHPLTQWAENKVMQRITKSATWKVTGVNGHVFEVADGGKKGLVDLYARTCSCRQWQLSGLPCGHVIVVSRFLNQTECSHWALHWFTRDVYRSTYEESINTPLRRPVMPITARLSTRSNIRS
ncbi:hypothetical protein E3N88_09928 [Mikania micrantha]|uniref:SWIM-type domain-containing protein n=1 Tax=Mikania micrantha TaxID=192012 RepID=A0A5N6PBJ1_9ASTR|nr:hypothetical protein E3N88_09928 [Mikania micrantha]